MSTVFIETRRETEVIDGEVITTDRRSEEIINTATIRGVFKDRFQISGLSPAEAADLALLLRAGALAAPVFKIEERTIGPTLGQDKHHAVRGRRRIAEPRWRRDVRRA